MCSGGPDGPALVWNVQYSGLHGYTANDGNHKLLTYLIELFCPINLLSDTEETWVYDQRFWFYTKVKKKKILLFYLHCWYSWHCFVLSQHIPCVSKLWPVALSWTWRQCRRPLRLFKPFSKYIFVINLPYCICKTTLKLGNESDFCNDPSDPYS